MRPGAGWLLGAALYAAALLPPLLAPIRRLHGHSRAYLREFAGVPAGVLLRDAAVNVALFVPLGWLLARAARSQNVTPLAGIVVAAAVGAAFSLGVETIQFFIATRYSSVLDVLANTAGTVLGAVLAGRHRRRA
jgi:glycopeptide antibiotics resistance protein